LLASAFVALAVQSFFGQAATESGAARRGGIEDGSARRRRSRRERIESAQVLCNLGDDPSKPVPRLKPAPVARKRTNPPEGMFGKNGVEYDEALRSSKAWYMLPSGANVPLYADLVGWHREFEAQKLTPIWFGDEMPEGSHFALVIVTPEG
jgi:hypothetical protein